MAAALDLLAGAALDDPAANGLTYTTDTSMEDQSSPITEHGDNRSPEPTLEGNGVLFAGAAGGPRARWSISTQAKQLLEDVFEETPFPERHVKADLAAKVQKRH